MDVLAGVGSGLGVALLGTFLFHGEKGMSTLLTVAIFVGVTVTHLL